MRDEVQCVHEADAAEDLRSLDAWLRSRGVPFRIYEAEGRQRIVVPDDAAAAAVREALALREQGALPASARHERAPSALAALLAARERHPACALLVALVILCFPLTMLPVASVQLFTLRWMMIVPIEPVGDFLDWSSLGSALQAGEFWHLWTPMLLHLSFMHLAFNLLGLWEFGRRIEAVAGTKRFVTLVLFLAPAANLAQYAMGDGPRFGGASGVVYGLLGFLIVANQRTPDPRWAVPAPLAGALLVGLVVFTTGVTEAFGLRVANGAHWGGLLLGMASGMAVPRRPGPDR